MALPNLAVPMKLDAFILNLEVCNGGDNDVRIAPITQPNYTFLRIEDFILQNDVLDHVDPHNSIPYKSNPRIMDLGKGVPRTNRIGVYLHWIMPRLYRTGEAASSQGQPGSPTSTSSASSGAGARVGKEGEDSTSDPSAPSYPNTPNRWLVIRKTDLNTISPQIQGFPEIQAWVVQSDVIRYIDGLDDSVDLQTDVSPFITAQLPLSRDGVTTGSAGDISIAQQAEVFIGMKKDAKDWQDSGNEPGEFVNLSLLSSSNQLFPDYQPHNSNVYSLIDNFSHNGVSLESAVADYYVIGWHSRSNEDPFDGHVADRQARLKALSLALNDPTGADVTGWLSDPRSTKILCHGAMYGVEWSSKSKPPVRPGDAFSNHLGNEMPIAVGTTPMDSLLAYLAHHHTEKLENDIWRLGALLRAQDDSTGGQQAGSDEVQNYNFSRSSGGTHYALSTDDSKPMQPPDPGLTDILNPLNRVQAMLDATSREYREKQWQTFALWWQYVTDRDNKEAITTQQYKQRVDALKVARDRLSDLQVALQGEVNDLKEQLPKNLNLKQAVLQDFSQQRDPTLFVGGLQSGWPVDFLDNLIVRIDSQIATFAPLDPEDSDLSDFYVDRLPRDLQDTALALVKEFVANTPAPNQLSNTAGYGQRDSSTTTVAPGTTFPPLYHDRGPETGKDPPTHALWRDRWEKTQPWFPLFLEWECQYFHLPWEKWSLEERTARLDQNKDMRYGIVEDLQYDTSNGTEVDCRTLSGRILLLPQPSFTLRGQLERLFSSTPEPVLETILPKAEREELLAAAAGLPFASAPLDGFLNHLVTRASGNHLKPNVRVPGQGLVPLVDAWKASMPANLDEVQVGKIEGESHITPYASLVSLSDQFDAFKPATHGQFKFTRLNIIDKFGQCACAIDPTPRVAGPPALYPWMSSYFEPQLRTGSGDSGSDNEGQNGDEGWANVIQRQVDSSSCEFMQIAPQINQGARLNVSFVVHDETQDSASNSYWRPIYEWENPIWGYIVVNYVDNGIQFFTSEGQFYREVRIASPNNPNPTSTGHQWLPFEPGTPTSGTQQLDQLIQRFQDPSNGAKYLEAFIAMVTGAARDTAPAPDTYGQFMSAIVGKPLALVNAGVSLELSTSSKRNESSRDKQQVFVQDWGLLNSDNASHQYQFTYKIGDRDRLHDGLIGYFEALPKPEPGNELDVDTVYTRYHEPTPSVRPGTNPTPEHMLSPFWQDLSKFDVTQPADAAMRFNTIKNGMMKGNVFGLIIDPFVPVNIYSSLLPVQPLRIPPWTWQSALKNLAAFFRFGPILTTEDVPQFDPGSRYGLHDTFQAPGQTTTTYPNSAVKLPAVRVAEWNWLQPYSTDRQTVGTRFMALGLGQLDSKPAYQQGPYSAIEGYLQMTAPIEPSDE